MRSVASKVPNTLKNAKFFGISKVTQSFTKTTLPGSGDLAAAEPGHHSLPMTRLACSKVEMEVRRAREEP